MRTVSVQELRSKLSALLAMAATGTRVLITKYRQPIAMLSAPELEHVNIGKRCGRGRLEPFLRQATGGRYLQVLAEDRGDDR